MPDKPKRGRPKKGETRPPSPSAKPKKSPVKLKEIKIPRGKLDLETARTICLYLKMGSWIETAAYAANVNPATVKRWIKLGRETQSLLENDQPIDPDRKMYADFFIAVKDAMARAELSDLKKINAAGRAGDWKAIAWKMEKRYDKWKQAKMKHEITGKDGTPIAIDHNVIEINPDLLPIEVCEAILASMKPAKDVTSDSKVHVIEGDVLKSIPKEVLSRGKDS